MSDEFDALYRELLHAEARVMAAEAAAPPTPDPFVDHAFRRADEWGRQIGRCVGAMKTAIEDLDAISGDRHPLIICAARVLRDALVDIGEG